MAGIAIFPLFPPSENEIENFNTIDCVPCGPEVNIIDDEELSGKSVIDMVGENSSIQFFCCCCHPLIVMHINSGNRFLYVIINVRDNLGKDRVFELMNRRSNISIIGSTCQVPMEIGEGWQRICISMDDMLSRAFGSKFSSCTSITFGGNCRLAKVFFQGEDYADPQLPSYLRVADSKKERYPIGTS